MPHLWWLCKGPLADKCRVNSLQKHLLSCVVFLSFGARLCKNDKCASVALTSYNLRVPETINMASHCQKLPGGCSWLQVGSPTLDPGALADDCMQQSHPQAQFSRNRFFISVVQRCTGAHASAELAKLNIIQKPSVNAPVPWQSFGSALQ